MKICITCQRPIKGRVLQEKCESCYQRKFATPLKAKNKICPICSITFEVIGAASSQKKFCSEECYKLNKKQYAKSRSVKKYKKTWTSENREKIRKISLKAYYKKKKNPEFRLKLNQISRFRFRLYNKKLSVTKIVLENLGCTVEELKIYLESKWEPWMNWSNYGNFNHKKDTWQIDHIKPLSLFDISDPEQLKEVCHYSNLQPLLSKTNLEKGNKYPYG